jgi:hypothetical protein
VNALELVGLVIFVVFFALPLAAVLISIDRDGRI